MPCKKRGIDGQFLHCLIVLALWHMLFRIVEIDQVPPSNVVEMLRGKSFQCTASFTLIWKSFQDKQSSLEVMQTLIYFSSSLSVSTNATCVDVLQSIILLDWNPVWKPIRLIEEILSTWISRGVLNSTFSIIKKFHF